MKNLRNPWPGPLSSKHFNRFEPGRQRRRLPPAVDPGQPENAFSGARFLATAIPAIPLPHLINAL
jgi:hypothetical protein